MNKKSYQTLRLSEFNVYDTERTLRENVYDLEIEIFRIKELVNKMIVQQIPSRLIIGWLRQMEHNAAEVVYINSIVQHHMNKYDFENESSLYREGVGMDD